MSLHKDIESYSLRLLSPFSGTTRIIQQGTVRAMSNDAVNWRIQIQLPSDEFNDTTKYSLFGLWSRTDGLKEFPVHSQQSISNYRQLAKTFVAQLPEMLDLLTFTLRDNIECWLLDTDHQPLALLNASQHTRLKPYSRQPVWIPCAPDDHTFVSTRYRPRPVQYDQRTSTSVHKDIVAHYLHQAAGPHRHIQWFQRQNDGSGIAQHTGRDEPLNNSLHLPAKHFPHFLIRQQWESSDIQFLFDDFFKWQSPWLLCLPDLDEHERLQLEQQACHYPQRLHALYHLYPELLQKELIHKTLIQARLEKTSPVNR